MRAVEKQMSDDEEDHTCPLCEEEMDLSDKNFIPCPCGYRVCEEGWFNSYLQFSLNFM